MSEAGGTVDIIIPVYNGAPTIASAIQSAMEQKGVKLGRIIVVDDGSTDETFASVEALKLPEVLLVRQENAGVAAARNTGIANASADWLAFLDADDCWSNEKLQVQLDLAVRHRVPFVCSAAGEHGNRKDGVITCFSLWHGNFIATSSVMIRRETAQAHAPLFDAGMTFSEDYAAWFKILMLSSGYFTSRKLTHYAISPRPHYRFTRIIWNLFLLQAKVIHFAWRCDASPARKLSGVAIIVLGSALSFVSIIKRFLRSRRNERPPSSSGNI